MSIDIAEWLRGLGLEQYAPAFRDNEHPVKLEAVWPHARDFSR